MKCPNCGEEMAENSLYCEHCGEDIHIVPDFEPELEQTIQDILEELHGDMDDDPKEDEEGDTKEDYGKKPIRRKKIWPIVLITVMVLAFAAAGGAVWYAYGYYSEEYQLNRAAQYVALGQYDAAIAC